MAEVINRYASIDLFMPEDSHRVIREHVGANQPFSRQVDAWWIAFCLGIRDNQTRPLPDRRTKFMDGTILSSDPWRIIHLELIALGLRGEEILTHPRDVVQLATEHANYGLELLVDALTGQNEPTLAMMNFLDPTTA
ncbi:hypothetical protein ABZS66_44840 [Dactylosporangium sp. NPDC005572]|uniref:hypothetical protein n=1 Tax=Dactylosporangium sp. NPDC005572 TaxID=3156889 RepID=UPI0033A99F84